MTKDATEKNPFIYPESFQALVMRYQSREINRNELQETFTGHLSRHHEVQDAAAAYREDRISFSGLKDRMLEWQMSLDQLLKQHGIGRMMENFPTKGDPDAAHDREMRNQFARAVVYYGVRQAIQNPTELDQHYAGRGR